MNPTTVVIGGVGALLIYCAITDQDPREVIAGALNMNKSKSVKGAKAAAPVAPVVVPDDTGQQTGESYSDYFARIGGLSYGGGN